MSETSPTIEELEAQELELTLKLSIIRNQREKIIEETKLTRPIVIQVTEFSNEQIVFKTNGIPRDDVLELLRLTSSRFYDRVMQTNKIHARDWGEFRNSFKALPNTEVIISKELEEAIEQFINEPLITIVSGTKDIEIQLAKRNRDWYVFDKIPGKLITHKEGKSTIHVPFSEAWRLGQVISNYEDIEIDVATKELISKQTQTRIELDTIAQQEDCELEVFMNGQTLRPFQKVGVKFALMALGDWES